MKQSRYNEWVFTRGTIGPRGEGRVARGEGIGGVEGARGDL